MPKNLLPILAIGVVNFLVHKEIYTSIILIVIVPSLVVIVRGLNGKLPVLFVGDCFELSVGCETDIWGDNVEKEGDKVDNHDCLMTWVFAKERFLILVTGGKYDEDDHALLR